MTAIPALPDALSDDPASEWRIIREERVTATDVAALWRDVYTAPRKMSVEAACIARARAKLLYEAPSHPHHCKWGLLIETLAPSWYAYLSEVHGARCEIWRPSDPRAIEAWAQLCAEATWHHYPEGTVFARPMAGLALEASCTPDYLGIYEQHAEAPAGNATIAAIKRPIIVECKSVGWSRAHEWREGAPEHVLVQLRWQMLVTGISRGHIFAAISGSPPKIYAYSAAQLEHLDDRMLELASAFAIHLKEALHREGRFL